MLGIMMIAKYAMLASILFLINYFIVKCLYSFLHTVTLEKFIEFFKLDDDDDW